MSPFFNGFVNAIAVVDELQHGLSLAHAETERKTFRWLRDLGQEKIGPFGGGRNFEADSSPD
jgi:hypothetical protein